MVTKNDTLSQLYTGKISRRIFVGKFGDTRVHGTGTSWVTRSRSASSRTVRSSRPWPIHCTINYRCADKSTCLLPCQAAISENVIAGGRENGEEKYLNEKDRKETKNKESDSRKGDRVNL